MGNSSTGSSSGSAEPNAGSFLSLEELHNLGFAGLGEEVRVSRFARFYSPAGIFLGDNIRIDDFALVSAAHGEVRLAGRNHVAAGAMIHGPASLGMWATLSGRSAIYGVSDDFAVLDHTYPYHPHDVVIAEVVIGEDVVVGTGSTVLPAVRIADRIAIGAMSLVNRSLDAPGVYAGIPARRLGDREPRTGQ